MSEYYNTSPAPPQTYETIPAIATLLRAGSTLTAALGGSSRIYAEYSTLDKTLTNWKHLVVREPIRPSLAESIHRYADFRFDVFIEVSETTPNPRQFLQAAHAEVFSLLVGQTLSMTKAAVALPIERRQAPMAAQYDPVDHSYFSAARYSITLKPLGG